MSDSLQHRVGRNVRKHRHGLGLGQDAFAAQLGVHRTLVGSLERGERNITLQTLEKLAEKLGLTPMDLLTE